MTYFALLSGLPIESRKEIALMALEAACARLENLTHLVGNSAQFGSPGIDIAIKETREIRDACRTILLDK